MKLSKSIILIMSLFVTLLLVIPQFVHSKTPDGLTPAVETVCDDAGLTGAAWGLCNAYCEAMDCDSPNTRASERACECVLENFRKASGGINPPCIGGGEPG